MERILLQRWFQLTVGGVAAFVLGLAVWLLTFGGPLAAIERPDRLVLHGGSPTLAARVPLAAPQAAAAGWTEPAGAGKCITDQGRFFHKESEPYVLIYNRKESLIGMYFYSQKEMPSPPWRFFEAGATMFGAAGGHAGAVSPRFPKLGFDHWGLSVYFKTPSGPCRRGQRF